MLPPMQFKELNRRSAAEWLLLRNWRGCPLSQPMLMERKWQITEADGRLTRTVLSCRVMPPSRSTSTVQEIREKVWIRAANLNVVVSGGRGYRAIKPRFWKVNVAHKHIKQSQRLQQELSLISTAAYRFKSCKSVFIFCSVWQQVCIVF